MNKSNQIKTFVFNLKFPSSLSSHHATRLLLTFWANLLSAVSENKLKSEVGVKKCKKQKKFEHKKVSPVKRPKC